MPKKLKEEMQTITEYKSSDKNENEEMFKTLQTMQHSEQDVEQAGCCWNGDCLFVGMPGPTLDKCGRSDGASRKKVHHARMVNWVGQQDPNPECLKLCHDCCVNK